MSARKDLTGQRFGRLIVVRFYRLTKGKKAKWELDCDCGKKHYAITGDLNNGKVVSCGCFRSECVAQKNSNNALPGNEAAKNELFGKYKNDSGFRRSLEFSLTKEEFLSLTSQNCHYCGIEPLQMKTVHTHTYYHNGIDRKDNGSGYTVENCVPCCKICNFAKHSQSYEEFRQWVQRTHQHWATK